MKSGTSQESRAANEVQFELKYCERCGGLWLRPAGGAQIYCAACARKIAELPPAAMDAGSTDTPRGTEWAVNHGYCDDFDEDQGRGSRSRGGVS